MQISVIGAGRCDKELEEIAEKVGELLAEKGFVIINGGKDGVMKAVSKGARRKGGIVVGILPDLSDGNEFLSIRIKTNMGHARNAIIAQTGDVIISLGGGYGTISEIALALKNGKKVISIKPPIILDGMIVVNSAEEAVEKVLEVISCLKN